MPNGSSRRVRENGDSLAAEDWIDDPKAALSWLDQNKPAKDVAGYFVEEANRPIGFARGGVDTVKGLFDASMFAGRLLNPWDSSSSPPGKSAREQLVAAIDNSANGWRMAAANPRAGARAIGELWDDFYKSVEPSATPAAPTFLGEVDRRKSIGRNQGELAFDVASLVRGGPALKGLTKIGAAKALTDAEYAAANFTPLQIAAMSEKYTSLGHHVLAKRVTKGLPDIIRDHPLIMLKPAGITKRAMNELHFRVDPRFHGAKAPVDPAGPRGWSGKKLGIEKYGLLDRLAFGTPGYANAMLVLNALGATTPRQSPGARNGSGAQNLR